MEKIKGVLGSRKFWALVVALGLVLAKGLRPDFPLTEEQLTLAVGSLMAYVLGVALDRPGEKRD